MLPTNRASDRLSAPSTNTASVPSRWAVLSLTVPLGTTPWFIAPDDGEMVTVAVIAELEVSSPDAAGADLVAAAPKPPTPERAKVVAKATPPPAAPPKA